MLIMLCLGCVLVLSNLKFHFGAALSAARPARGAGRPPTGGPSNNKQY